MNMPNSNKNSLKIGYLCNKENQWIENTENHKLVSQKKIK